MPISRSRAHRKLLENTTAEARLLAESACRAALENLAVHEKDYRSHMSVEQHVLRNRLRSRARALGDARDTRTGLQGIRHLKELAAYEHWHRLLFTRFLTENHLLITDGWRIHRRTAATLAALAKQYNPVLRGWWNYFGEFYPSAMHSFAMYFDGKLMQWARRKYKTLERREQASVQWLIKMKNCFPRMFFYWSVTRYSVG